MNIRIIIELNWLKLKLRGIRIYMSYLVWTIEQKDKRIAKLDKRIALQKQALK